MMVETKSDPAVGIIRAIATCHNIEEKRHETYWQAIYMEQCPQAKGQKIHRTNKERQAPVQQPQSRA